MGGIDTTRTDALRSAVDLLRSIQAKIVALSDRDDDAWRRELIALRRRLQQQMTEVARLVEALDASAADMRRLRATLGRMRSNVALHQANWPAVAIDRADAGYKASVADVRTSSQDFITTVATLPS